MEGLPSHADSQSSSPDVCCTSKPICSNSRYPSVGVSENGQRIVVVCHGAFWTYSMYYCIGRVERDHIDWSKRKCIYHQPSSILPTFYYPKVVVSNAGSVIVAYGKVCPSKPQQRCFYRPGRIVDENTIEWGKEIKLGDGSNVAIAIHEYQSRVCLMFGRLSLGTRSIYVQGAVFDDSSNQPVLDSRVQTPCKSSWVKSMAITMNHKVIIIGFITQKGKIRMTIGSVIGNGEFEVKNMKDKVRRSDGKNLSIGITQGGEVILVYETSFNRVIKYDVGVMNDNDFTIAWSYSGMSRSIPSLCYGCHPSFSLLQNMTLSFIEVHSAQLGPQLRYSVRKITVTHSRLSETVQDISDSDTVRDLPSTDESRGPENVHQQTNRSQQSDGENTHSQMHQNRNHVHGTRMIVSPIETEERTTFEEAIIHLYENLYRFVIIITIISALLIILCGLSLQLVLDDDTSIILKLTLYTTLLGSMMAILILLWKVQRWLKLWKGTNEHTKDKHSAGTNKVKSLTELQVFIWEARLKYFNIGLHLGIDESTIKSIQLSKNNDVDNCFRAVLSDCVKKGITWDQVAEALKTPPVGHAQLGKQVQEHFCRREHS